MAEPRWLDTRELTTWQAFLAISTELNRRVEQHLREHAGLSNSQYEVLARLSVAPRGELRMTELADISRTSKSGLTYQIAQLARAGLVRRDATPDDDRGVVAALTTKGQRLLRRIAPTHAQLVRQLFRDGMTKAEFDGFAAGVAALRRSVVGDA